MRSRNETNDTITLKILVLFRRLLVMYFLNLVLMSSGRRVYPQSCFLYPAICVLKSKKICFATPSFLPQQPVRKVQKYNLIRQLLVTGLTNTHDLNCTKNQLLQRTDYSKSKKLIEILRNLVGLEEKKKIEVEQDVIYIATARQYRVCY